jgi:hypothetical protein
VFVAHGMLVVWFSVKPSCRNGTGASSVRLCAGPAHYAFANSHACFFRSKLRRGTRSSTAGCSVPSCWCLVCLSGSNRRYEMNQQSKVDSRGSRPSTWASDGRTATCEARLFRTDAVAALLVARVTKHGTVHGSAWFASDSALRVSQFNPQSISIVFVQAQGKKCLPAAKPRSQNKFAALGKTFAAYLNGVVQLCGGIFEDSWFDFAQAV